MVGLWCTGDGCDSARSRSRRIGPAIRLKTEVTGYVVGGALIQPRAGGSIQRTMQVDGREVTVTGSLLQPLTRRTNDMLRVALSGALLAVVITSSLVTRTRWDGLEKSISAHHRHADPHPIRRGLPGLRPRGAGVAVHDPVRPDPRPAVATADPLRGGRLDLRPRAVDHRQRPRRAAMAFRPVRPAAHRALPIPRRPALDRRCSPRSSPCPVRGCRRAGGTGGGGCCWPSSRSTWSSAPSCRPVRCWVWRSAGSSARW